MPDDIPERPSAQRPAPESQRWRRFWQGSLFGDFDQDIHVNAGFGFGLFPGFGFAFVRASITPYYWNDN